MHGTARSEGWKDLSLLTGILLLTRIAFRSRYLYDLDSINFALGLRRFDPGAHQPHPPGYFLYICLGQVVNMLLHDANAALVAISIAASCGALWITYFLADDWFGRSAALCTGVIFVFSPLMWFHGIVALTYAVEAFFSALTGYLCWRIYRGSQALILPAAFTAALAAGFRPSFLLFLAPLLLFSVIFSSIRISGARMTAAAATLILTVSAWFLPMIWQSGGIYAWSSSLLSLWRIVPAKTTIFNSPLGNSIARVLSIAVIYILCFGGAALLTFRSGLVDSELDRSKRMFIWAWIAPGLLFFGLIFFKFVNSGYLLLVSPPVFAWLGMRASRWYAGIAGQGKRIALTSVFAAANILIFLYAPVYCSFTAVHRFEAQLENVLTFIPQAASPADTMIIGFDSHFLGYRHAGYYLPGWFTAQFPEVKLLSGMRVFVMDHGDTQLASKLPLTRFRKFLFFPLPPDDPEYADYAARVRARFPKDALHTVVLGGREYTTGSIADLPRLFPVAAAPVHTADHVAGKLLTADDTRRASSPAELR